MENNVSQFRNSIQEYSNKLAQELQAGGTQSFKEFLKFAKNFHKYSANNRILIQIQNPDATQVSSFLKWKELGRFVKKGEKAIKILAPIFRKSNEKNAQGENVEKIDGVWFKTVPVFDISQTEGAEIPDWNIRPQLGSDDQGLYSLLKKQLENRGITVLEEKLNGPLGISYGGMIKIDNTNQDQVAMFLTLIHEAAHEILHKGSESHLLSKNDKECQAEATAYIVACHFGLESVVSAEYMIHWGNYEKEFLKNLSAVVKASEEILEMLPVNKEEEEEEKEQQTINENVTIAA